MSLSQRDRKIIWHPFTQEQTAAMPIAIKKGFGSYIYDENNKPYLDLVSSWWVNLHGHAHPTIAQAIYQQALALEHIMFAGFTHEPAVKLCENLKNLLPLQLSKYFFSDNGSTSIEVALKMAFQYWWNQGETQKTEFLSLEGGYHGDTVGAMSVGAKSGYFDPFTKLLFSVFTVPFPATWDNDDDVENKETQSLEILQEYLRINSDKVAALILEPLIQGACGMRICRSQFVDTLVNLVRSYGILIIFDEVMTGFGRTGSNFAFEQTEVVPDFLCLSKGLTGGFLPLALTVTNEKIYEAFLGDNFAQAFIHGHSYTANPLGCAAALASLELFCHPDTMESIQVIHNAHKDGIESLFIDCDNIEHKRILGTIAAFEVKNIYQTNLNEILKSKFLEQGLIIRPLGNTIYLLPPYSTKSSNLQEAYIKIKKVIKSL